MEQTITTRYRIAAIIILFVFTINMYNYGQATKVQTSSPALFLPQGYVIESISGSGFPRSTFNHVANINSMNPASIGDFKTISCGISYQVESAVRPAWMVNVGHERDKTGLPQSVGIVLPFAGFRVGLGFRQLYNSRLDYGKIERVTIEYPQGTGVYITASRTDIVNRYSGILSSSIDNVSGHKLNVGIQLNYNRFAGTEHVYDSYKANTNKMDWTLGLRYDVSKRFQIGLFFEKGFSFKEKAKIEVKDISDQIDIDPLVENGHKQYINPDLYTVYWQGRTPDKLNVGILYLLNSLMKFSLDMTQVYWSQLSENSKDSIDISGSIVYDMTRQISLCTGFLSTERRYDEETDLLFHTNDNLYSLFLLGGLKARLGHFDIDFAYVSSTFLSGDWRQQKIGKVIVGYYF